MSDSSAIGSAGTPLLGPAFLMLGNQFQRTLLGVLASVEGFSFQTTALATTGDQVDVLLGSTIEPCS